MKIPLPLIALVLLAAALVAPASAIIGYLPDETYTRYSDWTTHIDYNAYDPGGEVIGEVLIDVPPGTTVDFTFWAYNQEITGEINRTSNGPTSEIITYRIGDQTSGPHNSSTLFGLWALGDNRFSLRYGLDVETNILSLWLQNHNKGVGWENPFYAVSDIAYRVQVDSSQDVMVTITTAESDDMHAAIAELEEVSNNGLIQFVGILRGLFEGVYLVISLGWYLFKTIFIDNLLLFAGLFEAVGMCYAANKSRDIFQFFRKVVEYNVAAIKAMYWLIEKMVTIITRIIDALNPLG